MKALTDIILEKSTESFIDKIKAQGGKPLYKMTPEEARPVLDKSNRSLLRNLKFKWKIKQFPWGLREKHLLKFFALKMCKESSPLWYMCMALVGSWEIMGILNSWFAILSMELKSGLYL